MPLSFSEASVPVYAHLLTALSATLDKAEAHAKEQGYDPQVLLGARLFPDMWPLSTQVMAATNHAIRGAARLAGLSMPDPPEASASFDDLRTRIAWTIEFVKGVDASAIDAGGDREITFPMGDEKRTMSGRAYFLAFSLPNFYFHLTTAYDILRHNGVPLRKSDFAGGI